MHGNTESAGNITGNGVPGNRVAAFSETHQNIIHPFNHDPRGGFFLSHAADDFIQKRLMKRVLTGFGFEFFNQLQRRNFTVTHTDNQIIDGLESEILCYFHHLIGFKQGVEIQPLFSKGFFTHLPAKAHAAFFFLAFDPLPDP